MTTRFSSRDDAGLVHQLLLLVLVSGLAGVLVAGLLLPFVGAAGLVARSGAQRFEEMPKDLETPPLPERSRILDADGNTIAQFFYENRVNVGLGRVSKRMQDAVVAIEDSRFYSHGGVDMRGTARALVQNSTGDSVQGGSTLTQQYVKRVLVETALLRGDKEAASEATDRSGADGYARKLRELRYSVALEKRLTKPQILERYLNIAYFGAGAYGVEAASRRFFSRSAQDLTLPQAAMLAGLVKAPGAYDPIRNPKAAKQRRNVVLERMAVLGKVKRTVADKAKRRPLGLRVTNVPNGCASAAETYFCDFVVETLKDDPRFGRTPTDRLNLLLRGGLVIRTTLQRKAQAAAQKAVQEHFPAKDPSQIGTAISMVEPGTGAIRAMAQNRTWGTKKKRGTTTINFNVERAYGGGVGFQPGSTFKAFTAAAAIEKGLPLSLRLPGRSPMKFKNFRNCETGAQFPPHKFKNSTGDRDRYTMREATAYSINTYFVGLSERTTQCAVASMAERLGLRNAHDGTRFDRVPSITLGVGSVAPLRMAEAYATFAARGVHCRAYPITEVTDRAGKRYPVTKPSCTKVLEPKVADGVNALMIGVIDGDIPGRTGGSLTLGRPAGGKTGTTSEAKAVWFTGYTPSLAASVWVGDPIGKPRSLHGVTIDGRYIPEATGSGLAGPVWKDAMLGALEGVPEKKFVAPSDEIAKGKRVRVPDVRGMSPQGAREVLEEAGFSVEIAEGYVSAPYVAFGEVAFSFPGRGAYNGDTVRVYVSNGRAEVPVARAPVRPDPQPRPRTKPPTSRPNPPPPTTKPPVRTTPKCLPNRPICKPPRRP